MEEPKDVPPEQLVKDMERLISQGFNVFVKFTCQHCGIRGGEIQADHIKSLALILQENNIKTFEEAQNCIELWDVTNGRTLCRECHIKTPTFGRNIILKQNENSNRLAGIPHN